jgi:hypothetical protein
MAYKACIEVACKPGPAGELSFCCLPKTAPQDVFNKANNYLDVCQIRKNHDDHDMYGYLFAP